jgi:hypothetical protein
MKKGLILFLCLLAVSGFAAEEDRTPYKFFIGANAYSGSPNYTITFLAECYDGVSSYGDWPLLADSMMDTIQSWGSPKPFIFGPYASTQELNLYVSDNTFTKADRDTVSTLWLYQYAEHYMDSIGVSPESLVVHIADDMLATTVADGYRKILTAGLNQSEKRYDYQYWNNTSADTFCYPTGYTWLANGYNDDTKAAIAYAFKRHFLEDSASYGSGKYHYTCYFADNQYRNLTSPRLPSYNTIDSTRGGPTSGLDWVEQAGIESTIDSLYKYYDNSTLLIDSAIDAVMNAFCDANGLTDSVIRFANVDKYNNTHAQIQIPYTSLNFELIFSYNGADWRNWRNTYQNAELLQQWGDSTGAKKRYGLFECRLDAFADEGEWYTSDRLYYGVYAWFLTFQEDNMYLYPARFNDTTRWRYIYEVDLGSRIDATFDTTDDATGSCNFWGYGDCRFVVQCKYLNGADTAITLYRTGYGGETGQETDSFEVSLGNSYYKVDVDADTALGAVSSVWLKPCEGWIGVQGAPAAARQGRQDRG